MTQLDSQKLETLRSMLQQVLDGQERALSLNGARGHGSLGPGVQVGEPRQDGKLGAQRGGVHRPILSWSRP